MKLLMTIAKSCTIGNTGHNWKLDSFKVLDGQYDITLFITVESIAREFGINVESQGNIKRQRSN